MNKFLATYLFMLIILTTSAVYAGGGNGKVLALKGTVHIMQYKKAYKKVPLVRNQTIYPRDIIITSKNGVAVIGLADGSRITIKQNSRVKFSLVSRKSQRIKVSNGGILAKVKKLKSQKGFSVNSPSGVAGVRGTKFSVEYDEKSKDKKVDVYEGEVDYSQDYHTQRQKVKLPSGKAVSVKKGNKRMIKVRKSDPKTLKKYNKILEEFTENLNGWEFN
jgi:hypothetical protein